MAEGARQARVALPMNRFPVLMGIAGVLQVVGWVGIAIGAILVVVAIYNLSEKAGGRGNEPLAVLFALLPGIGLSLGGLLVVALGEAARVFVSTENNTYWLVQAQQSLPDHRERLAEGE